MLQIRTQFLSWPISVTCPNNHPGFVLCAGMFARSYVGSSLWDSLRRSRPAPRKSGSGKDSLERPSLRLGLAPSLGQLS